MKATFMEGRGPSGTTALANRISDRRSGTLCSCSHSWAHGNRLELTSREQDVLQQIRLNLSDKEIAQELGVEVSTVKSYVRRLLRKFGAYFCWDLREQFPGTIWKL
jgi:DNA-binding NarL/FixJ family response regulator